MHKHSPTRRIILLVLLALLALLRLVWWTVRWAVRRARRHYRRVRKQRHYRYERMLIETSSANRLCYVNGDVDNLMHIKGTTCHTPPHTSWIAYWEHEMQKCNPCWKRPTRCPCFHGGGVTRPELDWTSKKVHGAHVLFQDKDKNTYGGIVPVSAKANTQEYDIKWECDVVTVIDFQKLTYVGSLKVSQKKSFNKYLDTRENKWVTIEEKSHKHFERIDEVKRNVDEKQVEVEGLVKVNKEKVKWRSIYSVDGDIPIYIEILANCIRLTGFFRRYINWLTDAEAIPSLSENTMNEVSEATSLSLSISASPLSPPLLIF